MEYKAAQQKPGSLHADTTVHVHSAELHAGACSVSAELALRPQATLKRQRQSMDISSVSSTHANALKEGSAFKALLQLQFYFRLSRARRFFLTRLILLLFSCSLLALQSQGGGRGHARASIFLYRMLH